MKSINHHNALHPTQTEDRCRASIPTPNMPKPLLLPIILIISGSCAYNVLTPCHNWGGDFAAYIMQSISIVQGDPMQFVTANRLTVEQSSGPIGPIAYPWGFPLLLAPVYSLFGLNILALKIPCVACFLTFLCVIWYGFQRHHSDLWRIILVCLFALNPWMVSSMNDIMSDVPFLLFSTVSVFLIGHVVVQRRRIISDTSDHILIAIIIAAAFFVRTNGLLLLGVLAISQTVAALRACLDRPAEKNSQTHINLRYTVRRLRPGDLRTVLIGILPYAAFLFVICVWGFFFPQGGSSHASHLAQVTTQSITGNLSHYCNVPQEFLEGVPVKHLFYGAAIPLALAGLLKRYRTDYHMISYIILTFLLYLVWPHRQGLRFLLPVLPFCLSFLLTGLEGPYDSSREKDRALWKAICVVPIIFVVLCFGRLSAERAFVNLYRDKGCSDGPFSKTSAQMFSFVGTSTSTDSMIVFFKPSVMKLLTARPSVRIDKVEQLPRVGYLCFFRHAAKQISRSDLENLLKGGRAQLVFVNADFEVYQLNHA